MIILSGYFGFDNWGDEAILESLCQQWESLGVKRKELVVLARDPLKVRQQYGTEAVSRMDIAGIFRLLRQRPIVVSGGGSLLQDSTSWRPIPYYLGLVEWAQLMGCPVIMYAQGIGPIHRRWLQKWSVRAFSRATASSVRDFESLRMLKDWGLKHHLPKLTADPVYGLQWPDAEPEFQREPARKLLLNLRPFPDGRIHQRQWPDLLRSWRNDGWQLHFLPLGPGDREVGEGLRAQCNFLEILEPTTLSGVLRCVGSHSMFVSMRLHGVIFAALSGALPIGVTYDPKVHAAVAQLKAPAADPEDLTSLQTTVWQSWEDSDTIRHEVHAQVSQLRSRSQENRKVLRTVYESWLRQHSIRHST